MPDTSHPSLPSPSAGGRSPRPSARSPDTSTPANSRRRCTRASAARPPRTLPDARHTPGWRRVERASPCPAPAGRAHSPGSQNSCLTRSDRPVLKTLPGLPRPRLHEHVRPDNTLFDCMQPEISALIESRRIPRVYRTFRRPRNYAEDRIFLRKDRAISLSRGTSPRPYHWPLVNHGGSVQ